MSGLLSRVRRLASGAVAAVAQPAIRVGSRALLARVTVRIEGLEYLPRTGPVLIASRHFHHLYDGCVFLSMLPRPVHILVGLDWIGSRRGRRLMEWACRTARWPIVVRADRPPGASAAGPTPRRGAFSADERVHYLRRAVHASTTLLRAGRVLVVFPEAYPNVDPTYTPKPDDNAFLPFHAGFLRLVEAAQRDERTRVAIVPAGFSYRRGSRWNTTVRFGPPLYLRARGDRLALLRTVEEQVLLLSQ